MKVVNKSDLINALHKKYGIKLYKSYDIVNDIFDLIQGYLKQHKVVRISGIGKFIVRKHAGHQGRNPQNGEPLTIHDHYYVLFRDSRKLRDNINK